jgi:hypothetical protein
MESSGWTRGLLSRICAMHPLSGWRACRWALPLIVALPAAAHGGEVSHPRGVWGTAPACEGWRAGEEPRPELTLYDIGEQWIRRHAFYCLIRPQMTVRTPDGRWLLEVLCGEDARQAGHYLGLTLDADNALTATWNAVGDRTSFTFGPFEHCGVPTGER